MKRHLAIALTLGSIGGAVAQDGDIAIDRPAVEDILACSALRGANARLACFDAAASTLAEALGRARPSTATTPRPSPAPRIGSPTATATAPTFDAAREAASDEADASKSETATESDRGPSVDPNALEEREEFTAQVVEQRTDRFGDLYVRLDNGQRWKQTEGGKVYVDEPPYAVEFDRGLFGGYSMRILHKKRSIRVKQLR